MKKYEKRSCFSVNGGGGGVALSAINLLISSPGGGQQHQRLGPTQTLLQVGLNRPPILGNYCLVISRPKKPTAGFRPGQGLRTGTGLAPEEN